MLVVTVHVRDLLKASQGPPVRTLVETCSVIRALNGDGSESMWQSSEVRSQMFLCLCFLDSCTGSLVGCACSVDMFASIRIHVQARHKFVVGKKLDKCQQRGGVTDYSVNVGGGAVARHAPAL